jgi:signal transduction histidine kinase
MSSIAVRAPGADTDAARAPGRSTLVAVAVAGLVVAVGSLALALSSESSSNINIALLEWISIPYVIGGLVAWWRRPDSRLGPLMVAGGFATVVSALQFTSVDLPYTLGATFDVLPAALFLHVYLAFPSGRLRSDFERFLVVVAYTAAIGLQLVKLTLGGFGPSNLLELTAHAELSHRVEQVQLLTVSAACLAAIGVLATRRRKGGRPLRRAPALLVDSFALGLVMIAILFVDAAFGGPGFLYIQRLTLLILGASPLVFLIGLLSARLARSAVVGLVVDLRDDPAPAHLQSALARALRDPSLQLVYWLEEFGTYADAEGQPIDPPRPGGRRTVTPIERDGVEIAALFHDRSLEDEPELLGAVTAAAAIAIENARLQVELRARVEELRGSRARIVEAASKERQRLERNLHDGAQQRLVALSLELGMLERNVRTDAETRARLEAARGEVTASLAELREIARGIHPAVVSGHGLAVALEQLAARCPVPATLRSTLDERLPEPVEMAAYYVVSESMANVGKYAQASTVEILVTPVAGTLLVEISDDGVGGADSERGTGLRGLADRVEALGGRLQVWSPEGEGTRVRAEIPCEL